MPILIVNHSQQQHGLPLKERVLIGRRPFNTVVLADPDVSRLHAWIGRRDGRWMLFDAGSRQGTFVNGWALTGPHPLVEGDEIRVGQATLTYHDAEELPAEVLPMDSAPPLPASDPYDGGIYFDCACGGPMWVAASLAGSTGRCRYCGQRLVVPHQSGGKARPVAPPAMERKARPPRAERKPATAAPPSRRPASPVAQKMTAAQAVAAPAKEAASPATAPDAGDTQAVVCSICQTPILAGEEKKTCPSCHLAYHRQCWEENFGCGAYGCDQVNILAPQEQLAQEAAATADSVPSTQHSTLSAAASTFPWESVLLALSFVATALGALAFGLPSVIMLVWTIVFLVRRKAARKGMVIGAMIVSIIGALAGCVTSLFWWKQIRVWEMFFK